MKSSLLLFCVFVASFCFATTDCQSTFQMGTSNGPVAFCITENGNVASLIGGDVLLNGAEGYAICPYNGGSYYDLGGYGDAGGWQQSVITQPKGPNTFPLTISRTTMDGIFTLIQAFSPASGRRGVKIAMTLVGPGSGQLIRYADAIGDAQEHGDAALRSAFIVSQFGLMAAPTPSQYVLSKILFGGAGQDPCNPIQPSQLPYKGDAALEIVWVFASGKKTPAGLEYTPIW